jgi:hypothetical protein
MGAGGFLRHVPGSVVLLFARVDGRGGDAWRDGAAGVGAAGGEFRQPLYSIVETSLRGFEERQSAGWLHLVLDPPSQPSTF